MGVWSVVSFVVTTMTTIKTAVRVGYVAALAYFGPTLMVTTLGIPGFIGLSAITYASHML